MRLYLKFSMRCALICFYVVNTIDKQSDLFFPKKTGLVVLNKHEQCIMHGKLFNIYIKLGFSGDSG